MEEIMKVIVTLIFLLSFFRLECVINVINHVDEESVIYNETEEKIIIREIDLDGLNKIFDFKQDLILVIVWSGCRPCQSAKQAIISSFSKDRLAVFALMDYESVADNKIFKEHDLKKAIPLTIIIKRGVIVETIIGFNDGYIRKLEQAIRDNEI